MTPLSTTNYASDSPFPAATADYAASELNPTPNAETSSYRTEGRTEPRSASVRPHSQSPFRHDLRHSEQSHTSTRSSSPASFKHHDGYHNDGPRQTILDSFAPRVAFFASEDTDDIAREKGFPAGFCSLLRPFTEYVPGKVVIRDSVGASKAWDDFSIRLIRYGEASRKYSSSLDHMYNVHATSPHSATSSAIHDRQNPIDAVVDHSLRSAAEILQSPVEAKPGNELQQLKPGPPTSTYGLYLRKLLSEPAQVPYETFSHPVACIIAVSSRSPQPLEKIRQLYSVSGHGNANIPPWVGVDYLRYYVLVHDEDHDDIITSTALFDLMKRHFGLHCYLLRIRSERCLKTGLDVVQLPKCQWMPAEEEMAEIEDSGTCACSQSSRELTSSRPSRCLRRSNTCF